MNRTTLTTEAFRGTSIRILKKLSVVLLGVVAFFSLRVLENAKTNYERQRAEPIVIVDVADTNRELVVKLESQKLQERLEAIIDPSPQALTKLKQEDPDGVSPRVSALETLSNTIKNSIREARRSPFENQEKFVEYLTGRINSAKVAADKQLSDTKAKRSKWFEELGAKTSKSPVEDFEEELRNGSDSKFMAKFETAVETKRESLKLNDELSPQNLVTLAKKVDDERDLEDQKEVSNAAYNNIDRLHSDFVPVFLTPYVRNQKNPSPLSSSLSEMVFDERRGGHVIYQVFYLAFICVLVFGILFPIYLLLRIFPAFSSGVEPLREQAKGLLTRRGAASLAAPALMKTVALSAAAVGIAAAVVIANNPVTAPKPATDVALEARPDTSGNPLARPPVGPGGRPTSSPSPEDTTGSNPSPSPTPTPSDSPERPINLYPTFTPTFTLDDSRVARLESNYLAAKDQLDALRKGKLDEQIFKEQTTAFTAADKKLNDQIADLPTIRNDVSVLKGDVSDLTNKETTLRADLKKTETDLSTRLDANTVALSGFREGTQGRSIGSRARELLGLEQYEARPESNEILRQLICRTSCGKAEEDILTRLTALVGQGKMGKDTFLGRLGIRPNSKVRRSNWEALRESLILRYSRVAY